MRSRGGTLITAVLILVLAGAAALSARPARDEPTSPELAAARQSLMLGDVEEAIRLYREFLEAHPEDLRAFWGLVKAYAAAGMDREEVVPLLEDRVRKRPKDLQAMVELGEAYARLGEHEPAHEVWMRALHIGPPSVMRYSEIGSLEVRHRMYDQAIETFTEARRVSEDAVLFSQELAQIHTALADYEAAIDECILTVGAHPGMVQWATNRVELMLDEGAERSVIERRVESIAELPGEGPGTLTFAGSVFLILDRPDDALTAFLRADDLADGEGRTLIEYGMILRDEGLPTRAREAFRVVEERYPRSVNAAVAGIEAAGILGLTGDAAGAVLELKAVGATYVNEPSGGEALLEAARIELRDLRDPAAALSTLEGLRGGPRRRIRKLEQEAGLVEADAYLALGRFDDAHAQGESIAKDREKGVIHERAMFLAGYASFLNLDIDGALAELRAMVEDEVSGKLANDALRLMLAIAEAKESQDLGAITLFSEAHAARLAGDESVAWDHLSRLAAEYPETNVAIEGRMLQGEMAEGDGDHRRALEIYADVVAGTDRIALRAEAMMRRGDILRERMGRVDDALAEYSGILEGLPPNFLSGEARRKADRIRRGREIEG